MEPNITNEKQSIGTYFLVIIIIVALGAAGMHIWFALESDDTSIQATTPTVADSKPYPENFALIEAQIRELNESYLEFETNIGVRE